MQNWPDPSSAESIAAFANSSAFSANAVGVKKTGFKDPISANTGIGTGRSCANLINNFPTRPEPVKPIAVINGSFANQWVISGFTP